MEEGNYEQQKISRNSNSNINIYHGMLGTQWETENTIGKRFKVHPTGAVNIHKVEDTPISFG